MFTKILIWEGKLSIINRLFLDTHECNNNTADLSTNTEGNVFLEFKSTLGFDIPLMKISRSGTMFTEHETSFVASKNSKQNAIVRLRLSLVRFLRVWNPLSSSSS